MLTGKCDEAMEPKEEVNPLSLKMVKFVKMIIFHSLFFQTSYYSILLLCISLKWSLNYSGYISSVYNSVFLLSEICIHNFCTCHWD